MPTYSEVKISDMRVKSKNEKVKSLGDYLKAVDDICERFQEKDKKTSNHTPGLWFRGVKDKDYIMLPSIARGKWNARYEKIFLAKFKAKTMHYAGMMPLHMFLDEASGYLSWLFLMKQYNIPSRIMDWSRDALIALFFAVDGNAKEDEEGKDAAVWCLDPAKLNEGMDGKSFCTPGDILSAREKSVYHLYGPQSNGINHGRPCAVYSPLSSSQVLVQKAGFMIFPYSVNMMPLDRLPESKHYLEKIIICSEAKKNIANQLKNYGISRSQLFPQMGSITDAIRD